MPSDSELGYTPPSAMPDYLIRHATLRQLQVFEAIVRLGSFTRAAEELFLTQPTVSMQIKKLADSLGLALFEHVGRNVRPTEAGLELYEACRKIFETLANLEMKMADLKGIRRGRLRLGVITTAKYFAPEVLGEFNEKVGAVNPLGIGAAQHVRQPELQVQIAMIHRANLPGEIAEIGLALAAGEPCHAA